MSDVLIYLTLASAILVILFIVALLRRSSSSSSAVQKEQVEPRRPRNDPTVQVRRVGGRVVRSRLHRTRLGGNAANTFEEERRIDNDDDNDLPRFDENDDDGEESSIIAKFPDEKIGTKKRKKLELKAEKKANQEQEMQMREERKKRQELLDEQRKIDDEAARLEDAKKEELERLQKEEKERQEHEEYLKLKASFTIESEGFDHEGDDVEGQDLLKEFVKYIKDEKVVILEDLAARFKLKTQDVIDRVNSLMESEDLMGVIDDRGKFIYISMEELQSVAKFIRQRGRVTISELAESSNVLINMNPNKNVDVTCSN